MAGLIGLLRHSARCFSELQCGLSASSSSLLPSLLICRRGIVYKLFVGGLSFSTTEKELSESFSQYGQVIDSKIIMDRVTDKSKGFGFVTFTSDEEAQSAISEMNGKRLNGQHIFVDIARPKLDSDEFQLPIARGPPNPA